MFKKKTKEIKKKYLIVISGDSSASCERELTQKEYELIDGIFNDTESRYCSGYIVAIPSNEEIIEFGKEYHMFCAMKCYITFNAFYHDHEHWPNCLYDRVVNTLVKEKILTKE